MKYFLLSLLLFLGCIVYAQTNSIVGKWKGKSLCQQKNSPCKDEVVVYDISPLNQKDSFVIEAYKIVNDKLEAMGPLNCKYNSQQQTLQCLFKDNWLWMFHISGNKMEGTLTRLSDNTLYRKVSITKA
jgi:hypothetical protein